MSIFKWLSQAPRHYNNSLTEWEDLSFPSTPKSDPNGPNFDYRNLTDDFPQNNTEKRCYYNIQMPHTWEAASTIHPHIHFIQNQPCTPTFKLEYRWLSIGGRVSSSQWQTLELKDVSESYESKGVHQILLNKYMGIPGTDRSLSDIIQCILYRDDNVYDGVCKVLSFDFHVELLI